MDYYRALIGIVSAFFFFFFPCGRSVSVRVSTWVVKAMAASRLMPACCIPRDNTVPKTCPKAALRLRTQHLECRAAAASGCLDTKPTLGRGPALRRSPGIPVISVSHGPSAPALPPQAGHCSAPRRTCSPWPPEGPRADGADGAKRPHSPSPARQERRCSSQLVKIMRLITPDLL